MGNCSPLFKLLLMLTIDNEYNMGDIVYVKTDSEQLPRIVTAIIVTGRDILYECAAFVDISSHYGFELSPEKDILL